MNYLGDYPTSAVIDFKWNTNGANGASITRATNGSIRIYKNNSTTERTSGNGITDTEDFDSLTGVHHLRIDTSDNTDAGFYAAGNEYTVVLQGATIDGQTVNAVIATFSIERANGVLALLKGANGLANIKSQTAAIETDTQDIQARLPAALTADGNIKADALRISGSATAADDVEAKIANLDAAITTRATPAQVQTELGTYGALKPTVAGRTLDVSAGGEAGLDWANIGSPTTSVNLSGTNIDTDQVIASVSGSVGSVTGAVASVTNKVTPIDVDGITFASFAEFLLAVLGGVASPSGSDVAFKKRDGTTTKATITYGDSDGQRSASVINS